MGVGLTPYRAVPGLAGRVEFGRRCEDSPRFLVGVYDCLPILSFLSGVPSTLSEPGRGMWRNEIVSPVALFKE